MPLVSAQEQSSSQAVANADKFIHAQFQGASIGGSREAFKEAITLLIDDGEPPASPIVFFAGYKETSLTVNEELAHKLAISTLTASARRLPGMRFDREKSPHPEAFYWFEVTANVPDGVSALLGYFAVNMRTGDVWNPVQCRKLTSTVIRHFQEQLRQKGAISTAELHQMADEAPCQP